ncbi:hypothetical protein JT359_18550 [Candidatus Poribacteria bacterium]|nr:hypothetical protein [Candidatus Poribacteria bacterium]
MKDQVRRARNLKVGLILGIIFLGLFTITTLGFVIGFEAPLSIKRLVSVITTIIAVVIGVFLIGAAIIEIIIKTGLISFIVKSVKKGYRKVRG